MEPVSTPDAPAIGGHYSQAIVHDGIVYVSGQLPVRPGSQEHHISSIEEQTRQAMHNLAAILDAAESRLDLVLQTTIYISDLSLWGRVNAVYAEVMGEHRPARAIIPTAELHHGYQIEIQAIAAVR